ncbi:dihydrodipicolinate synthase family protein [Variovorax paradoxus]|uniref:L-2-keto-3-deoxyarabonate dehydratase n=1 Tax=Variovorax paradoxus TaxID=34073 RepID=A0A0H2M8K8_VARPD|nr:dihydrodipicolinate synthase family protein [Variovorax paradoxus]KLN53385.1 L-2-keto-3-deoxyarabonate dehydratase [Variovorax paradoxus]
MMHSGQRKARYAGAFSVVPTIFDERGELDLDGQKRCIDFIIEAGADGLCILANYSEQFALSDREREILTTTIFEHVAGRVPVIATTSHFSSQICAERSKRAAQAGAAMVMIMPPYHGATIRASESGVGEFYRRVADGLDIPIMLQDAPMSGTPLSAAFLAQLAHDVPAVCYFKIEVAQSAGKLRELIRLGGDAIEGPWDGEEAITLFADLEAGATGGILGAGYPDGLQPIIRDYLAGNREQAMRGYERWLPLINYENRQCGLLASKALMKAGGIIRCDMARHPIPALHPATEAGLIEIARNLDAMVLRWAR